MIELRHVARPLSDNRQSRIGFREIRRELERTPESGTGVVEPAEDPHDLAERIPRLGIVRVERDAVPAARLAPLGVSGSDQGRAHPRGNAGWLGCKAIAW